MVLRQLEETLLSLPKLPAFIRSACIVPVLLGLTLIVLMFIDLTLLPVFHKTPRAGSKC